MTTTDLARARTNDPGAKSTAARTRHRTSGRPRRSGPDMPVAATGDGELVDISGIVDTVDTYAFIRTSGYLPGPNDVYVSAGQIKQYGLRRGDTVTGAARPRSTSDSQQKRDKNHPLVRLDTINGMDPEEARRRPEFYKLTPLYPQERLRSGDRAAHPDHPRDRSGDADRQGPAGVDRLPAQGG